ncbi:unannotated protein [freshwater metagenome]|uniref:Unannotated protein n=1 Tax=freshwater metagenome TaxID=449393 RepID=A0A6J6XM34_9ZZZZ|nr:hypothetical protein [Actinomycetota bacterium]MSW23993.1 hypothetical protein [Actinomycetota bacterium]MSX29637.1 hypothetical protein [Actinomycetota bacterium]MSX96788.1 hypothetical protein [Actinomycetota bacterium]MSZ79668.1 hypothetical protein [Actinomycetota bacterium]
MLIKNPQLAPGVHFYRRSDTRMQIGINPNASLIIESHIGKQLGQLLNGDTSITKICEILAESGIDQISSQNFMSQLIHLGLLIPGPTTQTHDDKNPVNAVQRHNLFRETRGDLAAIKSRIECEISITGAGRLGMTLCLLLASSGFPNITVHDEGLVREGDLTPWGASRIDIGLRRDHVARLLIERITRGASAHQNSFRFRASRKLEILLPDQRADFPWIEATSADAMTANDAPYLFAATSTGSSLISSVITPGKDPCLRCQHLHHSDQDPDWPLIDLQVAHQAQLDTAPISLIMRTALEIQRIIERWIDVSEIPLPSVKHLSVSALDEIYPTHFHPSCGCRWDLTD